MPNLFLHHLRRLHLLLITFTAAILVILSAVPSVAISSEDIDNMSSQVTVLIGKKLQKGDLEEKREFNPGSGVIVGHQGNTYYVVTNTHVVKQPIIGGRWGVRTPDGEVYQVIDQDNNMIRFGNYESNEKPIPGFDLALVKFTSNRDYPVAVMGNSLQLNTNDRVFISGWPAPEDLTARRQRQFISGIVAKIDPSPMDDGGYNLLYSNYTRPGMSGSPIFNAQGELVGIHGRGRKKVTYCVDPEINTDNSCGIQGIHLISQVESKRIQLAFNPPPVKLAVIEQGRKSKAKADVIEDIYKLFSDLRTPLHDCSPSVLIDQPDCN
ncbi:MAG: hypothetical protein RLZZ507_801 [Cyanobacteriota bacterium]|jgi:hypothetical protein